MSGLSHVATFALGGAIALGGVLIDPSPYAPRSRQTAPSFGSAAAPTVAVSDGGCIIGDIETLRRAGIAINLPKAP